jgi:hypothetical protein
MLILLAPNYIILRYWLHQEQVQASLPFSQHSRRNGSRWFAASDQAEKKRLMKKALLEKEGHHANSRSKMVRLEKLFACLSAIMVT